MFILLVTRSTRTTTMTFSLAKKQVISKFRTRVEPVDSTNWTFSVKVVSARKIIKQACRVLNPNTVCVNPHQLPFDGEVRIQVTAQHASTVVQGQMVLKWFCNDIFHPIVVLWRQLFERVGTVYTHQPSLYRCSLRMRYGTAHDIYPLYAHWRLLHSSVSSFVRKKTYGACDAAPLDPSWNLWKKFTPFEGRRIRMSRGDDNLHLIRQRDVPDASIGWLEPFPLTELDLKFHDALYPGAIYQWREVRNTSVFRFISFRKHVVLVCYHPSWNSATVVNTSSARFADSLADYSDETESPAAWSQGSTQSFTQTDSKRVQAFRKERLAFYEGVWATLTRKLCGLLEDNPVYISHWDIQGHNDCLIWTYYIAYQLYEKLYRQGKKTYFSHHRVMQALWSLRSAMQTRAKRIPQPDNLHYQRFVCQALKEEKPWSRRREESSYFFATLTYTCRWNCKELTKDDKLMHTLIDNTINRASICHTPQEIARRIRTSRELLSVWFQGDLVAVATVHQRRKKEIRLVNPHYNGDRSLCQVISNAIKKRCRERRKRSMRKGGNPKPIPPSACTPRKRKKPASSPNSLINK